MIHFHPDENLLAEYTAGTLERGLAIGVKTHISLCTECQRKVSQLNTIGAALFEPYESGSSSQINVKLSNTEQTQSFSALMARIRSEQANDHTRDTSPTELPLTPPKHQDLPPIVNKLLPQRSKLQWKKISSSLSQANLNTGQDEFEVCLHKIKQGGKVVEHDHRGREMTIVLRGAFSDEHGTYHRGDFIFREPGQIHRPTATEDQDCLCLSVSEAPVKLTGLLGVMLNPFLSFSPA